MNFMNFQNNIENFEASMQLIPYIFYWIEMYSIEISDLDGKSEPILHREWIHIKGFLT